MLIARFSFRLPARPFTRLACLVFFDFARADSFTTDFLFLDDVAGVDRGPDPEEAASPLDLDGCRRFKRSRAERHDRLEGGEVADGEGSSGTSNSDSCASTSKRFDLVLVFIIDLHFQHTVRTGKKETQTYDSNKKLKRPMSVVGCAVMR